MLILWIFAAAAFLFLLQRVIYQELWSKGVSVRIRFDAAAVKAGESVTLLERVENRKLLPLPVFAYEYTLARNYLVMTETSGRQRRVKIKLALPANRAVVNRTKIEGLPRGVYALSDVMLKGSDIFYSCRLEKPALCTAQLTVYPEKIPANRLSLPFRSILGTVLTRRLTLEDPFQLRGIRQYEIYDSMRDINWKASAKTGELKVNQHEHTTDESLMLLLDMGSGSEAQRETVLSLASSLSELFLRRGVNVALQANARSCVTSGRIRVLPGSGAGHQTTVDEALAQIKLEATVMEAFPVFLASLSPAELSGSLPVVISADREGASLEAFHQVLGARNGYYLSVDRDAEVSTDRIKVFVWDASLQEVRI